jgi:hypothetical protein
VDGHHAGEEPVVGQWMMRELRRHGYEVSQGTLYALLASMEEVEELYREVAS